MSAFYGMMPAMSITIHQVLDQLRASALNERDQGDKFERLMQGYFRTDPEWSLQFSDVWMWSEWPGRGGKPDTGIDLVAKIRDIDELTAIQCKFYAAHHTVQKSDIDSFFTASGKIGFSRRIIVSTTDKWSKNAEDALADQQVPTQRLDISNLSESVIDWAEYSLVTPSVMPTRGPKQLRPHQTIALQKVRDGLANKPRGQLIMACGTGKTFTSLKIAEDLVGTDGMVLFLVPSISLLSQTVREWSQQASVDLRPFAVCSDVHVGRKDNEDMRSVDLSEPATTNPVKLLERMGRTSGAGKMTVIFSTYQSIQVVADAQADGLDEFDLVICDEAHRTTGVTVAGEDESAFVRVHDKDFLKARKRLYMTATPRLYSDTSKSKAAEVNAPIASMDDEDLYGPELHRLGFGEAVDQGLLSDYKVLVLAVDEAGVSRQFQSQFAENHELKLDDAAKLVGCWNGLAKRGLDQGRLHANAAPMRRAVAFAETIEVSQKVARLFEVVSDQLVADSDEDNPLTCEAKHVDGTFNVLKRNARLAWLEADQPENTNVCRILSNVRCLSEGVDVPALDAVLFLNPRNSVVDVVQSVGRVMRKAPGKEYGYVILPIGVPADTPPEVALADNKKYRVVWQVLQALRAHDERFNAMVNKIELNRERDDKLQVIGIDIGDRQDRKDDSAEPAQLALAWSDEWRDAIYAKIVAKVGDRGYWEDWAKDIAVIADRHITRITTLLEDENLGIHDKFERFHAGLQANLNDGITRANAIEMLAQHIITKPVFDALFEGYAFAEHNPVSLVMQDMLDALDTQGIDKETESLDKFYASVRLRAEGIDNAEGKQRIVTELYEKFFKNAFPKAAESLGIVYTPVEIVDFILRSVEHLLNTELNASLNDEGVHVLDPFTGTGTFIVRLLQSGLIGADNLLRKYLQELHANEISLLAYYVAAVNIEATFHGLHDQGTGKYLPFDGIVLTDTFQMHEDDDKLDYAVFPQNNDRVVRQKAADIRVIIGNPPYSAKQGSANDANANLRYPTLDARIESTYAARSVAKNKNSLYDSYIRAMRWASDRIGDRGLVAFVSNGGYLDSNTADGVRMALKEEFDAVYVYNLRGNQRAADWRAEGGKVFGEGSQSTIAISFFLKCSDQPRKRTGGIHYHDIGSFLTREEKLQIIADVAFPDVPWQSIAPNSAGDWINQRREDFEKFIPMGGGGGSLFQKSSNGLGTSRDAWVYNFSLPRLRSSVDTSIAFYNQLVTKKRKFADLQEDELDARRIKWSSSLAPRLDRREVLKCDGEFREAIYRPFTREYLYFSRTLNHRPGVMPAAFPEKGISNAGIYVTGAGGTKPFSVLIVDAPPDLNLWGSEGGQFFPRYTFELSDPSQLAFEGAESYRRFDNVTDAALREFQAVYGHSVNKDDIFYYVYGLLHSPTYRSEFVSDLKKMLPRIPKVRDFAGFSEAGRKLADLHLNYEKVEPYMLEEIVTGTGPQADLYHVRKVAFGKGPRVDGKLTKDRNRIIYNSRITVAGIPDEAYRYVLGTRSAVEWIMERYQVNTDKPSGIVNDPNDWAVEHGEPRYILDLLKRIVTVSVETMEIVDRLPALDIIESK